MILQPHATKWLCLCHVATRNHKHVTKFWTAYPQRRVDSRSATREIALYQLRGQHPSEIPHLVRQRHVDGAGGKVSICHIA